MYGLVVLAFQCVYDVNKLVPLRLCVASIPLFRVALLALSITRDSRAKMLYANLCDKEKRKPVPGHSNGLSSVCIEAAYYNL